MRVAQSSKALPLVVNFGKLQTVNNQHVTRCRFGSVRSGKSWYSAFDFGDVTLLVVGYEFAQLPILESISGRID